MLASLRQSVATFGGAPVSKAWFVAFVYLDLLLTLIAMGRGFTELNPNMAWMLARPPEMLLVKGVLPVLIAWLVPGPLLVPAIMLMAAITGWNIAQFLL